MTYKLPNGKTVDCTLAQARRAWEICRHFLVESAEIMRTTDTLWVNDKNARRSYIILPNGDTYLRSSVIFPKAPPRMPSEVQAEESSVEFCRGLTMAVEMACCRRFPLTEQDKAVLNAAIQAKAEVKLQLLLDTLLSNSDNAAVAAMFKAIKSDLEKDETDTLETYADGFCRGKVSAVRVAWQVQFQDEMPKGLASILRDTWHRHADSLDVILKYIVSSWSRGSVVAEIEKMGELNVSWRKAGGGA